MRFLDPRLLVLATALAGGCRTVPDLGTVDLQGPGWRVREGQGVWTKAAGDAAVAGEVLVATRPDGACFVQFAKPPFTLATARREAGGWRLELAPPGRGTGGVGPAPGGIVWFALADAVRGQAVGSGWRFEPREDSGWCLTNTATGEGVEGFLAP